MFTIIFFLVSRQVNLNRQAFEFSEKLQEMAGELVALSTENRELRRLYAEAVNSNFDKIPKGLKSKYGVLLNELIGDEKKPTD